MTKEELKQKADLFASIMSWDEQEDTWEDIAERAYIAGATEATKELEKENAELKETVTKMNNVITKTFSNLTKAKELLKKFMKFYERTARECYSKDFQKTLADTEQFLSEVEK